MAKLFGAQKMVLQTIQNAQGETSNYIEDSKLAQETKITLSDMRNWLLTLDQEEYVDLGLTNNGLSASITPKGRLTAGLFRPIPSTQVPEPARSRSKTGREKALVIGISEYPPPIPKLSAVANDVREMATLLGSDKGQFPAPNVLRLTDGEATSEKVIEAIETTFARVQPDDAVFAYMAGHGEVVDGEYYFIAHNTYVQEIPSTGVPLKKIKKAFDASPSQRAFLWLDFCHSGGIIPREPRAEPDDREVISRALEVVQGQGKMIIAASTPSQKAYESAAVGHGLFTEALLKGLKGEAANKGEVTINSLYDFIDRKMGSDRQRPMMFGQMTGRVVLMHYANGCLALPAERRLATKETKPTRISMMGEQKEPPLNNTHQKYVTQFLCSVINATELSKVDIIFYHYSQFFDPAINKDIQNLHVYFWLPHPTVFTHRILYDTPVVAICDAGVLEIEKTLTSSDKAFLHTCYSFLPSELNSNKRKHFIELCGKVLRGALVLAPVLPSTFLGAGLQNPNVSYCAILNLILLPLVSWHSQMSFINFNLIVPSLGVYNEEIEKTCKHIIKYGYENGRYSVRCILDGKDENFYFYAAQFIAWAVSRYMRDKKDAWMRYIQESFH